MFLHAKERRRDVNAIERLTSVMLECSKQVLLFFLLSYFAFKTSVIG